jgi:hypothetical protein
VPRHLVSLALASVLLCGVAIGCPSSSLPVPARAPEAAKPNNAAPREPAPGASEMAASEPSTVPRDRRWSAPVDLDAREGTAEFPKIAMDANGNALVAWYREGKGYSTVHARRFDSTSARWDSLQTFSTPDRNGQEPQVAMTRAGAAVLLWAEYDDGNGAARVARYAPKTGWGDREELTPWQPGAVYSPAVALSARGDIVAVWELESGEQNSVHSNRFDAASGAWSGPEPREQNRFANHIPSVAIDDFGNAIVAWTHHRKPKVVIHVARFDATAGTWQTLPAVSDRTWKPYRPVVTMGSNGAAWITWRSRRDFRDRMFVTAWNAGAARWDRTMLLGGDIDGVRQGQLLHDDAALVAVWAQAADHEQHLFWRELDADSRAWSEPAAIDTKSTGINHGIEFASDGAGNVQVVWERHQDGRSDLFASRLDHGAGRWSTPTMLDTDEKAQAEWAAIAAAADGTAIVVWTEKGDRGSQLFARRFE